MKKILILLAASFFSIASFAQSTTQQLTDQANVIRNETIPGANTPLRVGNMFINEIKSFKNIVDTYAAAGSADAYTITLNSGVTTLTGKYVSFLILINTSNTGTSTITPLGLGTKTVKKNGTQNLEADDFEAGHIYHIAYDGTNFQLIGGGDGGGGGGATQFTELSDVPSDYTGYGDSLVVVNSGETAIEFRGIKTINGESIIGSGDIVVGGGASSAEDVTFDPFGGISATDVQAMGEELDTEKQNALISGTNIKTVNGSSLLGSGNISIAGLSDGDYGDFTVTSSGTVATIDNSAVTNAKINDVALSKITGMGTGVPAALAINIGSAGAPILFNGAAGTFASGVATNLTGTASGLTAGTVTTNANLTGDVTSTGNATVIASGIIVNADVNASAAIDATKLVDGTVSSTELQYINSLTSNAQTQFDAKANEAITWNTQTANYIGVLSDKATKIIRMNVATANTFTVQPFATVAYPEGAVINIQNDGAGTTTLTPGAGVTLTPKLGSGLTILQNGFATIVHSPTQNTWYVYNTSSGGSALTKTDDTNVTLTLGGSPTTALNASTSITVGWTGVLSQARGGKGNGTVYTQGSILFQGASSQTTEDNANLFYDDANNRVGFGTATPTSQLSFAAGTSSANTAQMDMAAGTLETTIRALGVINMGASEIYINGTTLMRRSPGGIIAQGFADVNNAGASPTETDMFTYTTKANALLTNGDVIELTASGTLNDATSTPRIQVYFGGTSIGDTGALTITGTPFYKVEVTVVKTGTTTARATVVVKSTSGLTVDYVKETDLTGLTLTSTNIIKYTGIASGAGGSASDITHKMGHVKYFPAANN